MNHRIKVTLEQYNGLLEAFRTDPRPAHCARIVGCDPKTARKAWEYGWPHANLRPLREVLAEEQLELRARMQSEKERADNLSSELEAKRRAEVREKAVLDATASRAQEGQMVRLARGASVQLLATLTGVAGGAAKVAQQVKQSLDALAAPDPVTGAPRQLSTSEAANLVRMLSTLTGALRQANDAAARSMEMERVLMGEPTHLVGHLHANVENISMDEALHRIERTKLALERAKSRGIVLEGEVATPAKADTSAGEGSAPTAPPGLPLH